MRVENCFLGLARLVATVVVRELGVLEIGERQAEARMHVGLAGEADRGAGVAVIAHLPRDDLGALRLAQRVPVVPGKLYRRCRSPPSPSTGRSRAPSGTGAISSSFSASSTAGSFERCR